jgi:hypothetical protein
MTVQQKIEEDYIFGCIKYKANCSLYLMPIAYWILDYKKYDPNYNPDDWEFIFRDNILVVNDSNIDKFMNAIEVDKIQPDEFSKSTYRLTFFIDFDTKLFISSFGDIEVEEYVPNNWQGKYGDPTGYLPFQCKILINRNLS